VNAFQSIGRENSAFGCETFLWIALERQILIFHFGKNALGMPP